MSKPFLLIVGSGPDVWDDVQGFWDMDPPPHDVCCVNNAGLHWPCAFEHWVSYHPVWMVNQAREHGMTGDNGPILHGHIETDGVDCVWRHRRDEVGSSGLFAVRLALDWLGYGQVVLAGIPITNETPAFYDGETPYETHYLHHWRERAPKYQGRIKSMSGNTMALFGAPTREWLGGNDG